VDATADLARNQISASMKLRPVLWETQSLPEPLDLQVFFGADRMAVLVANASAFGSTSSPRRACNPTARGDNPGR
jgi:hypothetical protein